MEFNYSALVKKSWKDAWKNKLLWLFGIFIASGVEGINYRDSFDLQAMQTEAFSWTQSGIPRGAYLVITVVGIILLIVFFILSIIATSAIIKGVANVGTGAKNKFKELWKLGVERFWKIFALELIVALAVLVLMAPALLIFLGVGWLSIVVMIWILLVIIGLVAIGNFMYYILGYAIIDNKDIKESILFGWKLFANNLKISILVSLISLGLAIAFALGLALAVVIALIPFVLLGFLLGLAGPLGALIAGILAALVVLALVLAARGLMNTFLYSLGVYTFMELTERSVLKGK
ncbi:MAG: hypothetical protein ACOZBH_01865 [Patescibacteria group bacterium]